MCMCIEGGVASIIEQKGQPEETAVPLIHLDRHHTYNVNVNKKYLQMSVCKNEYVCICKNCVYGYG